MFAARPCKAGSARRLVKTAVTADRAALDISKMAPLGDRLIVKPAQEETVSSGGVLLASPSSQAAQLPQFGEVLSIGDKVDLAIKTGDTIVYSKYGTSDVEVADGKIVFVGKDSVLGVYSKTKSYLKSFSKSSKKQGVSNTVDGTVSSAAGTEIILPEVSKIVSEAFTKAHQAADAAPPVSEMSNSNGPAVVHAAEDEDRAVPVSPDAGFDGTAEDVDPVDPTEETHVGEPADSVPATDDPATGEASKTPQQHNWLSVAAVGVLATAMAVVFKKVRG